MIGTSPLWLLLSLGCGGGTPATPDVRKAPAEHVNPLVKPGGIVGADQLKRTSKPVPAAVADGPSMEELPQDQPGAVILVVLDTVRADHLTACGYGRPTTTALQNLSELGGSFTCDAYAPATWTMPSHATFFTGLGIDAHDMHRKGLVLDEELETLAELYAARGYQTLAISANPVVHEQTGLLQGFQRSVVPKGLKSPLRGDTFTRVVKSELTRLDRDKPLFLFLNLFDAHEPYPAIPAGVPWLPVRPSLNFKPNVREPSNPYFAYITGEMSEQDRKDYEAHVTDTYDMGVALADRNLGRALKMIQRMGWIGHGVRMVVTSDHGENLGEHNNVRHDGPPWEAVTRVPFFYLDTLAGGPIELPTPMSAGHTFSLLAHGTLDAELGPPTSGSIRYGGQAGRSEPPPVPAGVTPRYADALAVWGPDGAKLMWQSGHTQRYDLRIDPREQSPLPVGEHTLAPVLLEAVAAHKTSKARALGRTADADVLQMLEEVGYVEEE